MRINHERLLKDLRQLATFGQADTGVNRLSFTPEDLAARRWLLRQMHDAGLEAHIDGIGNVYGRTPDVFKAVLIGSHTDSVPRGGWLDGAMGVIYGLAIARARMAAGASDQLGVDVISFADEEGTFRALAGSLSFCDELSEADIAAATNRRGQTLPDALAQSGYTQHPRAQVDADRHVAYLEAHIEQGPRLEVENKKIGVVTSIVGIRRVQLTFHGQADHAGTTPMSLRKDAGTALIRCCYDVIECFERARSPESVWNFGVASFEPGAGNVVPHTTSMLVEFRDPSTAVLDRLDAQIQAAVRRADGRDRVRVKAEQLVSISPAAMNLELTADIESAAHKRQAATLRMPSGAGHDAMVLTKYVPTAMLFIPSVGGRSHDIAEESDEGDICLGADVLGDTVDLLAKRLA